MPLIPKITRKRTIPDAVIALATTSPEAPSH